MTRSARLTQKRLEENILRCSKCGGDDLYYDRSIETDEDGNEHQVIFCNECKAKVGGRKMKKIKLKLERKCERVGWMVMIRSDKLMGWVPCVNSIGKKRADAIRWFGTNMYKRWQSRGLACCTAVYRIIEEAT